MSKSAPAPKATETLTLNDVNTKVRGAYFVVTQGKTGVLVPYETFERAYRQHTGETLIASAVRLFGAVMNWKAAVAHLFALLPNIVDVSMGNERHLIIVDECAQAAKPRTQDDAEPSFLATPFTVLKRSVARVFEAIRKRLGLVCPDPQAVPETVPVEADPLPVLPAKVPINIGMKVLKALRDLLPEPYSTLPSETLLRELVRRRMAVALEHQAFARVPGGNPHRYVCDLGIRDKQGRCRLYADFVLIRGEKGAYKSALLQVVPLGGTCIAPDGLPTQFGACLLEHLGANVPKLSERLRGEAFDFARLLDWGGWHHVAVKNMPRIRTALGNRVALTSDKDLADQLGTDFRGACIVGKRGDPRFAPASAWHLEHKQWSWYIPLYCAPDAMLPELAAVVRKSDASGTSYCWVTILHARDAARKVLAANNTHAQWVFNVLREQKKAEALPMSA